MQTRDPRIDPQPGDVVKGQWGEIRTVETRDNAVSFHRRAPWGGRHRHWCSGLGQWREWAREGKDIHAS